MLPVKFVPLFPLKDFGPRFARIFKVKPDLTWQLPLKHVGELSHLAFPPVKGVIVGQNKPHPAYIKLRSAQILFDGNVSDDAPTLSALKLEQLRHYLSNIINRKELFDAGMRLRWGEKYTSENVFNALVGRLVQPEFCLGPKYGEEQGAVVRALNAMQAEMNLFMATGREGRRRTLADLSSLVLRLADSRISLDLSGLPIVSFDRTFHGIYLRGAKLTGSFFAGELEGADLREADMRNAVLGSVSRAMPLVLAGANLENADLRDALIDSNVVTAGTNLAGVNCSGARINLTSVGEGLFYEKNFDGNWLRSNDYVGMRGGAVEANITLFVGKGEDNAIWPSRTSSTDMAVCRLLASLAPQGALPTRIVIKRAPLQQLLDRAAVTK